MSFPQGLKNCERDCMAISCSMAVKTKAFGFKCCQTSKLHRIKITKSCSSLKASISHWQMLSVSKRIATNKCWGSRSYLIQKPDIICVTYKSGINYLISLELIL